MPSFQMEGEPGLEQILAILTKESPTLNWLPQKNDDPLQLEEAHLEQLIEYVKKSQDYKILYTNYTVTEKSK